MKLQIHTFIYIFIFFIIFYFIYVFILKNFNKENFGNYGNFQIQNILGSSYPSSIVNLLVSDTYPEKKNNIISNNNSSDIWTDYPIYTLGSYAQITNNIRYPDKPDDGKCTPASMCNTLYDNKNIGNNNIEILPPVINTNPSQNTRIGYFTTNQNLLSFTTNLQNILY